MSCTLKRLSGSLDPINYDNLREAVASGSRCIDALAVTRSIFPATPSFEQPRLE